MTLAERSATAEHPDRGTLTVTAYVRWDESVRLFAGTVPGVPGAYTQGATIEELRDNLREVMELLAEEGLLDLDGIPEFVGLHQVAIAV